MLFSIYGAVLGSDYRYRIRTTSEKEQGLKVQIFYRLTVLTIGCKNQN